MTTPGAEWAQCECVHFRASHPGDGACRRTLSATDFVSEWRCPCQQYQPRDSGAGPPPPEPAPLTAGAIARSLVDAGQARYREQLAELWRGVVEQLPDD